MNWIVAAAIVVALVLYGHVSNSEEWTIEVYDDQGFHICFIGTMSEKEAQKEAKRFARDYIITMPELGLFHYGRDCKPCKHRFCAVSTENEWFSGKHWQPIETYGLSRETKKRLERRL